MTDKPDTWDVRQSEASGNWYVNTGREIWKCFDEDRARLIASAPELRAEIERLRAALTLGQVMLDSLNDENEFNPDTVHAFAVALGDMSTKVFKS